MSESSQAQFKPIIANGVNFFCQVRGKGQALLLLPSICGDSSPFDVVAEKLADQYQVITFDLRGHSRSSLPDGWHITTMAEQADDAVAILKELGIRSAAVFGTGVGSLITLEMMQRHPKMVRKAILHDPLIYTALDDGSYKNISWDTANLLRSTFFKQGHQAALIAMMRWEYGMEVMASLREAMMMQIMQNSEAFVMVYFPAYAFYKPDVAKLAAIKTPTKILFSTNTYPWRRDMANWLSERIHVTPEPFLGEHAPYFLHPVEMADALKVHLEK